MGAVPSAADLSKLANDSDEIVAFDDSAGAKEAAADLQYYPPNIPNFARPAKRLPSTPEVSQGQNSEPEIPDLESVASDSLVDAVDANFPTHLHVHFQPVISPRRHCKVANYSNDSLVDSGEFECIVLS